MEINDLEKKLTSAVDNAMKQLVEGSLGKRVNRIEELVRAIRSEQNGITITDKERAEIVEAARVLAGIHTKANEALVGDVDTRGGYLVPQDVANTILRVSQQAGIVPALAQRWTVRRDSIEVPAYSGAVLEGEFVGQDQESSVSTLAFGQATLTVKKWALNFAVARDLLEDADVDLADWLVALAAEGLANRLDKEGLVGDGTTTAFVGVLNEAGTTTVSMGAGETSFSNLTVDHLLDLEAAVADNFATGVYVMSFSVWNHVRKLKDGNGQYVVSVNRNVIAQRQRTNVLAPVGDINGNPVYTSRYMPKMTDSAADTPFVVYGVFDAGLAYGVHHGMRTMTFESGNFSGEIARKDQIALAFRARVGTKVVLPEAFAVLKTAAV